MSAPRKRMREVESYPIEDVRVPEFLSKASQSSSAPTYNKIRRRKFRQDEEVRRRNFELHEEERSIQWNECLPSLTWKVSESVGGRLITGEPIFAGEEKYLLLAYDHAIKVYSATTSQLVRTLPASAEESGEATITAYALSSTKPNTIYVSTIGHISHWDWVAGEQLGRWISKAQIFGLATSALAIGDSTFDLVYAREKRGEHWMISAYNLLHGTFLADKERTQLFETRRPILGLYVTQSGENIVASYGEYLVVGVTKHRNIPTLSMLAFIWRELRTPERITCLDVREIVTRQLSRGKGTKGPAKHLKSQYSLDVVLGGLKGAIYIHENLLHKLDQKEPDAQITKAVNLTPLKLHWHREAVATVKWSVDGNYIISGGSETVLVLWQLDTGKRQFLPHLSSAIESLVVSPTGSSYAVRLADNSAMIMSTTELMPKASVAGIQARCLRPVLPSQFYVQTVDTMESKRSNTLDPGLLKTPAVINPLYPNRLITASPASQPGAAPSASYASAPYLQTFDFIAGRHVSRQALTRTNATTINVGPEANKIGEPDIKLMQVSHDGQWLVTVDEWLPPRRDGDFLACYKSEAAEKQIARREMFLKFWSWHADRQEWELNTRIDEPHPARDGFAGTSNILGLAVSPNSTTLATLGEDGDVRIWSLKTRLRDGVVVRGTNAQDLKTWSCQSSISLASHYDFDSSTSDSQRGFLAYSADGSVLVAALQSPPNHGHGNVHFIDPIAGVIKQSEPGLYSGELLALDIVGRYLILVSTTIAVWDIVLGEFLYGLSLQPNDLTAEQAATMTHLAVDQLSETFAISLPVVELSMSHKFSFQKVRRYSSAIAIFSPSDPIPCYSSSIEQVVTSLLPTAGMKGYLALNSACEISVLTPTFSPYRLTRDATTKLFNQPMDTPSELNLIKEDDEDHKDIVMTDGVKTFDQIDEGVKHSDSTQNTPFPPEPVEYGPSGHEDEDVPVVRQEQLADIFDIGPAFAMPPMGDLYEQVAELFSNKAITA
ncbi:MAG: hypothetical protein M1812_006405 [Candelaria pacifica]|nr:MAG: hypothetical protein M1812_006405 [Candelaria pacifica]